MIKRYCANCRQEYEFTPLAISGKSDLICPECGGVIDKNSRRPANENDDQTEEKLGRATAVVFHFFYCFYALLGIVGAVCFFLGIDWLLYAVTIISIIAFIIQLIMGTLSFASGLLFLPLGAIFGYLFLGKSIRSACLGIHIVFLIRHICRDIIYRIIIKLVRAGNE